MKRGLSARKILAVARKLVCKHFPFFRLPIYSLIPFETDAVDTLSVTKKLVLLFNPKFVQEIGIAGTAAVLLHEVSHVLRKHFDRAAALGVPVHMARLWNLCADAEINDGHPEALPLPEGCILPHLLPVPQEPGKLAERYYLVCRKKMKEEEEKQQKKKQQGGGGQGDDQSESQDGGGSQGDDQSQDGGGGQGDDQSQDGSQGGGDQGQAGDGQGQGQGDGQGPGQSDAGSPGGSGGSPGGSGGAPGGSGQSGGSGDPLDKYGPFGPGHGGCGSCCGNKSKGEPQDGEVEGKGRSESEMNRIRKSVARAIQDQAASDGQGTLSGSWKIWADSELEPPVVRWEDAVQRLCRSTYQHRRGLVSYRYDRPSRRQSVFGYGAGVPVLPRMVKPIPRVVFIADTSGSMGGMGPQGRLRPVMGEVKGLFDALGVDMVFGVCDAAMKDIKEVHSIEECLELLSGGGGTSFVPIFEAVEKMRPKPDLLIIGTDAIGPAPRQGPRNMATIWLTISEDENVRPWIEGAGRTPINWGHFINIKPSDLQKDKKAA